LSTPQARQVKLRNVMIVVLIGLLLAIWLIWSQWAALRGDPAAPSDPGVASDETGAAAAGERESPTAVAGAAEQRWTELLGRPPAWPDDVASTTDCESAEADLLRVCADLDSRDSIAAAGVPGGVCGLLREVADELVARPPVLTSELKSYQAIVSNVYHLFRVLGRERIALLRQIVGEDPQLAEPAAMAIHRWLSSRERCTRSGRTAIRLPALYDYAGFLFETMGGQALLRRRTPDTEALVSFYALLILDRADRQGHNPHGVDPRQEIERTRALLAKGPWVLGERYDSMLEEMATRWEQRTAE